MNWLYLSAGLSLLIYGEILLGKKVNFDKVIFTFVTIIILGAILTLEGLK